MKSTIYTTHTDPVSPMKDFLQGAVEQGFYSEPLDLLPENLIFRIDYTTEYEVMEYAIKAALRSLADDGLIVDTGRRVTSYVTGEEEVVWTAANPCRMPKGS
jgi:hypothetical protein